MLGTLGVGQQLVNRLAGEKLIGQEGSFRNQPSAFSTQPILGSSPPWLTAEG